jgi:hypothetical protein
MLTFANSISFISTTLHDRFFAKITSSDFGRFQGNICIKVHSYFPKIKDYEAMKEKFEDNKGLIRSAYRRRTDNAMVKGKRTKGKRTIY